MELNKLFEEIEENLEASRKVFLRTNLDEDENDFRSLHDAKLILKTLNTFAVSASELFTNFPALESLFEKEFGKFKLIFNRDNIVQTCLVEDYLIPDANEFPLPADHNIQTELLDNYTIAYKEWLENIKVQHQSSQVSILENFTMQLKQS